MDESKCVVLFLSDADSIRKIKRGNPFELDGVKQKKINLSGFMVGVNVADFRIYDNLNNYYWLSRKFLHQNDNTNASIRQIINGLSDHYLKV